MSIAQEEGLESAEELDQAGFDEELALLGGMSIAEISDEKLVHCTGCV